MLISLAIRSKSIFLFPAEVGIPFWAWVAVGVAGVALAGGVGGVGGVGVGITILYMRKKSKKKNGKI